MLKKIVIGLVLLGAGVGIGLWIGASPTGKEAGIEAQEEAAVYRCPMHPTVTSDRPGSCPICGMDLVQDKTQGSQSGGAQEKSGKRQIAYWRAPMDPSYISDKPGKSPMGMDLIPVYEDELSQAGTVQIDPVTVQNIGVKTDRVKRRSLDRRVRTVGRVDYDETRITDVNAKVAGWVEKLHVDYTGQKVEKGQPLLEIYSPELVAAQEEYLTALDYHQRLEESAAGEAVQGGRDLLKAAAQRLRYWDITEEQIAELERTRQVRRTMMLHSPQEGIVVHKAVLEGAHIMSGQHLYRIAELSRVWVYADIYEYELPWIEEGQEAKVSLSYLPDQVFRGQVTYIYPFLEPKTRTVKVRMAFANPNLELKPEMYANVEIQSPVSREALVVPVQSVIRSGERNVSIVSLGEGRFQPREVELGVESGGYVQVLKGLREGERIVTSAQFLIDSESNLKAAVGSMAEAPVEGGGMEGEGNEIEGMEPPEPQMEGMDHSDHQMEEGSSSGMKGMEHGEHEMAEMDTAHQAHSSEGQETRAGH